MGKIALRLTLLAAVCGLLVSSANSLTSDRIAQNRTAYEARQLLDVVGNRPYKIDKIDDATYRLSEAGQTRGYLFGIETNEGYNGRISLWLGVDLTGQILGVRVRHHEETPGLGDKIDIAVSDWIRAFDGRTLNGTVWNVKRNGGDFDQFTGATVTPRAVVHAVEKALRQRNVADMENKP